MIQLVGFVADLSGSENLLLECDPVVSLNGTTFVARGSSWTVDSLVPLAPDEMRFVKELPTDDVREISEGQVVWLAGNNFVADVQSNSAIRDFALRLGSTWSLYTRGFKWTFGSARDLRDLRVQQRNALVRQLHQLLFDPLEKSHGEAARAFRLYLVFETEQTRERFVNRALFYFETRDMTRFELTTRHAVSSGLFESRGDFDHAFEELKRSLLVERLDQRMLAPAPYSIRRGNPANAQRVFLDFRLSSHNRTRTWRDFIAAVEGPIFTDVAQGFNPLRVEIDD